MIVEEKIDQLSSLDLDGLERLFTNQEIRNEQQSFLTRFKFLLNVLTGLKLKKRT